MFSRMIKRMTKVRRHISNKETINDEKEAKGKRKRKEYEEEIIDKIEQKNIKIQKLIKKEKKTFKND
jgi:protein associated with RNAse G/E